MFPTCDPIHHMVFSDVDGKVCNLLLYIYMSINICGISTFIAFNLWILFNFYGNLWKIIYILTWGPQTFKSHMGIKDLKQTSQKDLYLHVHIFSPWVCRINFLDKDIAHTTVSFLEQHSDWWNTSIQFSPITVPLEVKGKGVVVIMKFP